MDFLPTFISLLGTTSVSAIITSILIPRTESRRLHSEIANIKSSLKEAPSASKQELTRALDANILRLAALSLVRFSTGTTLIAGFFGLIAMVGSGALIVNVVSPRGQEIVNFTSLSFKIDPLGSWALVIGSALIAISAGIAIPFFRSLLLKSARTEYVSSRLQLSPRLDPAPAAAATAAGATAAGATAAGATAAGATAAGATAAGATAAGATAAGATAAGATAAGATAAGNGSPPNLNPIQKLIAHTKKGINYIRTKLTNAVFTSD